MDARCTFVEFKGQNWCLWFSNLNSRYANCIKHASEAMRRNARPTQRSFWKTHFENGENCEATEIQVGSRGTIVNMASMSSFIAQPSFVPYNASKGAVIQMTRQDFLTIYSFLITWTKLTLKILKTDAVLWTLLKTTFVSTAWPPERWTPLLLRD